MERVIELVAFKNRVIVFFGPSSRPLTILFCRYMVSVTFLNCLNYCTSFNEYLLKQLTQYKNTI